MNRKKDFSFGQLHVQCVDAQSKK